MHQIVNPNQHIQDIQEKKNPKINMTQREIEIRVIKFLVQGEYKKPYPEIMQSKAIRKKKKTKEKQKWVKLGFWFDLTCE